MDATMPASRLRLLQVQTDITSCVDIYMQRHKELGGDGGGPAAHRFLSGSLFGSDLNRIVEPTLNSID